MNIDLLTEFFMWFTILNIVFIIFFYVMIRFGFNLVYNTFIKSFYLGTKEEFNKLIVSLFVLYRLSTVFFAVFPYLALLLIK